MNTLSFSVDTMGYSHDSRFSCNIHCNHTGTNVPPRLPHVPSGFRLLQRKHPSTTHRKNIRSSGTRPLNTLVFHPIFRFYYLYPCPYTSSTKSKKPSFAKSNRHLIFHRNRSHRVSYCLLMFLHETSHNVSELQCFLGKSTKSHHRILSRETYAPVDYQ